jgi:hypothetical protein
VRELNTSFQNQLKMWEKIGKEMQSERDGIFALTQPKRFGIALGGRFELRK